MPAAPVPLDHAPRAMREVDDVGKVVVNWRNVNSPRPDESEAREMPNNLAYRPDESAMICRQSPVIHRSCSEGAI